MNAPSTGTPPTRHRGRLVASIIGGAATAASLVIGFIAIVPILTENPSGVEKLSVRVEPYRPGDLVVFAVPTDAQLLSFPATDSPTCTEDQFAWLSAHGVESSTYFRVTITNGATSGNVVGFGDLLADGTTTDPAQAALLVECDRSGATQPRIAPARLVVSGGDTAYYDRSRLDDPGSSPDTPVIYNLQPGESGQFVLELVSTKQFTGAVNYSVTSGADSATHALDFGDALQVPGTSGAVYSTGAKVWSCLAAQSLDECLVDR